MKINFLYCTLFFIIFCSTQAQVNPASSSAFQQTRFADASTNESSGRIGAAVPLYSYQAGSLSVPVSLSYTGNGVKVAQECSWVGANWNLNAGGVITRTINSYPDEKATQRIFLDELAEQGSSLDAQEYLPEEGDTRDFRVDLFSYVFPGYSGSFYLDSNMTPHLLNNDSELKIEFSGSFATNTYSIIITTPQGIKYYFGGADASEQSSILRKIKQNGSWPLNTSIQQTLVPLATTAFYLYKIAGNYNYTTHTYDDEILLEYYTRPTVKNYVLYEQQEAVVAPIVTFDCTGLFGSPNIHSAVFHGTIHNLKKVQRIYSNNSPLEVRFTSENLVLPNAGIIPNNQYDDRILKSIQIYDTHIARNLSNFKLEHFLPAVGNTLKHRFFLTKVSTYNTATMTDPPCESYRMEYNSPESLPNRFSYDVDLLGYYNGTANSSLIAQYENMVVDGAFANLAVRESNITYATKGALTKIYYPSGGYSSFEYEQPMARAIIPQHKMLETYRNDPARIPTTRTLQEFTVGQLQIGGVPTLAIPENQMMTVNIGVEVGSGTTHGGDQIIVEVRDLTTSTTLPLYTLTMNSGILSYNTSAQFQLLAGHAYKVTLKQNPISPSGSENLLRAFAHCYFTAYEYFPALGIRAKRVTNYSGADVVNTTRYYYTRARHIGTSDDDSAVVTFEPDLDQSEEKISCTSQDLIVMGLLANPMATFFASADNQVQYKFVTLSYGGDNFELGGVEKEFRVVEGNEVTPFFPDPLADPETLEFGSCNLDNADGLNGTLLSQRVLENLDTDQVGLFLYVKSETKYNYDLTVDHQVDNVIPVRPISDTYLQISDAFGNPTIGTFSNFSYRYRLASVVSTNYLTPLAYPVSMLSPPEFTSVMSTQTNYYYEAGLRGLPSRITSIDSENRTIEQKMFYPVTTDILLLTGSGILQGDLDNYAKLRDQNIISAPFQTETYMHPEVGTPKLLSRTRSLFTNTGSKILPLRQQSAKAGGALTSNVFFSTYNAEGRPVEITMANGLTKTLLYGYRNNVVIAELVNAAYSSISGTVMTNLKAASDAVTEDDPLTPTVQEDLVSRAALEDLLSQLRTSKAEAQVTTYIYNADGTLNSVTDPRGYKITSEYDECKRYKLSRDADNNIIEKYKYHVNNN